MINQQSFHYAKLRSGHVTKEILKQRDQDYQTSNLDMVLSTNSLNLEGFSSKFDLLLKPIVNTLGFLFVENFSAILVKTIYFIEKIYEFFLMNKLTSFSNMLFIRRLVSFYS